jgi:hypothetical protein
VSIRILLTGLGLIVITAVASAQTDLDAFMARVLERRDDNWKKLQQYVLEERETFQLVGPGATPLFGFERDYLWFPRDGDGVFIKSPLRANGVAIGDAERRKAEVDWVEQEQRRERRRAEREAGGAGGDERGRESPDGREITESAVREVLEPGFVSAAYFMRFKFDPGQYALVGREKLEGRDVLRIEYYPTKLFSDDRPGRKEEVSKRAAEIETKMNKVSLVTLWIDRAGHQILKYEFENVGMDFLPARSIVRVDGMKAAMEMGQPFPDVWLPRSIRVGFDATMAVGEIDGRYVVEFHDYRLASVTTKVR